MFTCKFILCFQSWTKKSVRWYDKLKDLYELWKKHPEDLQQGLSKICVCTENFKIGDGQVHIKNLAGYIYNI